MPPLSCELQGFQWSPPPCRMQRTSSRTNCSLIGPHTSAIWSLSWSGSPMPASQCSPLMTAYRPMQQQQGRWRRRQVESSLSQHSRDMQRACCGQGDRTKCCAWRTCTQEPTAAAKTMCLPQCRYNMTLGVPASSGGLHEAAAQCAGTSCDAKPCLLSPSTYGNCPGWTAAELIYPTPNLPHQLAAVYLPTQVLHAGQLTKCSPPRPAHERHAERLWLCLSTPAHFQGSLLGACLLR